MSDTESFESVASSYDNYTWIGRDGVKRAIDRLKAAHDREIRDVIQQAYHRGFESGRHSMDAEHRAVAMRLRHLPLDGGSHENLSQIARAVYHSDWGWTKGACASLRDELVRLMGGVSDGNLTKSPKTIKSSELTTDLNHGNAEKPSITEVSDDTCCCAGGGACAADCGCDSWEQAEVNDGGTADDCAADSRGGNGCGDLHLAGVTDDVLDNERRKAIANLRKLSERGNVWGRELIIALGLSINASNDDMCDRLIHLLGGDQPSGIDVLRAMDAELDTDGTCPNDVPISSITDELCEWIREHTNSPKGFYEFNNWDVAILHGIADRIDEQFDRICTQQEAVLQSTIDGMVKEYEYDRLPDQLRIEKLMRQRDELMKQRAEMTAEMARLLKQRDELQEKYAELSAELSHQRTRMERACGAVYSAERERDELQAKLNAIRDALDG